METDATRLCALSVGLSDVNVLGVEDTDPAAPLRVHVETTLDVACCAACGTRARVKDRRPVALVDLAVFGRPAVLVWHKRRWTCAEPDCPTGTFTEIDRRIAAPRAKVNDRAGRWVTAQVGSDGRSVAEVARELGCDWHTVMDAVRSYGAPRIEHDDRISEVGALGLDETLFVRSGSKRTRSWSTSIVGLDGPAQLLDVVEGRTAKAASDWLDARSDAWWAGIRWATLDLPGQFRKTFNDSLPDAVQVADPFHVIKLANGRVDDCRRRQDDAPRRFEPHRSRPSGASSTMSIHPDPDSLADTGASPTRGPISRQETLRGFYTQPAEEAEAFLDELIADMGDESMPPEVRSLARTLRTWRDQILAWHRAKVANGPTESINSLIKRIKRICFGLRRFANYRIRVLLYCGQPKLRPTRRHHTR